MKKIFSGIILLLSAQFAFAAPVSRSTATEYARNFLGTQNLNLAFTTLEPTTKSSEVSFYAFNKPEGGWVIIAADDCATPVLAHCDKGSINPGNIPSNMKNYLRLATTNISKVSAAGKHPTKETSARWATKGKLTKADSYAEKVLKTANWSQDAPYNQTVCQQVLNRTVPVSGLYTGCVATAMAIVMQYHGYPAAPTGTIPSYKTETKKYTVPEINLSTYGNYDWANMPKSKPSTSAQKKAVADLIFHCGAMVQMDYTTEGSGANTYMIPSVLAKYMGYSPAAVEQYRETFTDNEWYDMLKAEIDADRPVIYGGADVKKDEGHEFVVDGYNSSKEVHINWGWSGVSNGWFAVNYLGNYTDVDDVFNYYDSGIFGLVPEKTGKGVPAIFLQSFWYGRDFYPGLMIKGDIAKGKTFSIEAYVYNFDEELSYDGPIIAALVDKEGKIKEYISPEYSFHVDKGDNGYCGEGYFECQCEITSDIKVGDFICVFYKDGWGNWLRLGGTTHTVTSTEEQDEPIYTVSRISAIPAVSYIYVPSDLKAGDVYYCDFVTGTKCPTSIAWSCDGADMPKLNIKLTAGTHIIKAAVKYADGSSETVTRKITVK